MDATETSALRPKQEQAIINLLKCPTLTDAAQLTGISETTLWRWLNDPAFSDAYEAAKRQTFDAALANLQEASKEAITTLKEVMTNRKASAAARVSAAKCVLDFGLKSSDYKRLEAKLEQLEDALGFRDAGVAA